jgi:hypothetical protein
MVMLPSERDEWKMKDDSGGKKCNEFCDMTD